MTGRFRLLKVPKKEWSTKILSFHHSLKLQYVCQIAIKLAFFFRCILNRHSIGMARPFGYSTAYLGTKAWWVSLPVLWIDEWAHRKSRAGNGPGSFEGRKTTPLNGWNLKKMDESIYFPATQKVALNKMNTENSQLEMKMILTSWYAIQKKYQSVLTDLECVQRCQMPKSRCFVRNGSPKWWDMATLTHANKKWYQGWRRIPFDFNTKEIQRNMRMAIQ